eukprot:GFUD01005232.1.p1 GENE.GFUD01005232.1~~GFUD01005232.1.p1  ORF type:complete len:108 (-),score=15.01 GFUD01005232.1:4-327(-)
MNNISILKFKIFQVITIFNIFIKVIILLQVIVVPIIKILVIFIIIILAQIIIINILTGIIFLLVTTFTLLCHCKAQNHPKQDISQHNQCSVAVCSVLCAVCCVHLTS